MSNGWWFLLRTDGREQLRAAVQMLENIGMEAYAGRARRELRAAGGTARQAAITAAVQLTAQEAQIVRLAASDLSDPEIASRLFLSPRTVQCHLGKVFTKLASPRATSSSAPWPAPETSARPAGPDWPPVLASLQIRAATGRCDDGAVAMLPGEGTCRCRSPMRRPSAGSPWGITRFTRMSRLTSR
jgi:DNA-binding CsgD family transcriptional regulator